MGPELHVLGAGSILPRSGYGAAGYALRPAPRTSGAPVTLLDCGPGSVRRLADAGIGLEEVRRVVFSHYHLDHCLDLFALFFARLNPAFDPVPPLELVGPVGLRELVEKAPLALGRYARDPNATVHEVELDGDGVGRFHAPEVELTCRATGHTKEAVAWRASFADGSALAYSGDTGEVDAVAEVARDVDLFLCECSFPDEEATSNHLSPSGAARLAARAGARRLVLTHFYPSMDPAAARATAAATFDGPIDLACDGARFPVATAAERGRAAEAGR